MKKHTSLAAVAAVVIAAGCAAAAGEGAYGEIERQFAAADRENAALQAGLEDRCKLSDYKTFVKAVNGTNVWTMALQKALDEHEVVVIPACPEP